MLKQKVQNHQKLNLDYNQDYVNGITKKDYGALFNYVSSIKPETILDLCGGSGSLAVKLTEMGYDVYLLDHAGQLIEKAIQKGLAREKAITADILKLKNESLGENFDLVVMKSSSHEFPKDKRKLVDATAFRLIKKGGYFIDWDAYFPTEDLSVWATKWINLKDEIAGLSDLVKNRSLVIESEAIANLKDVGFHDIRVVYRGLYTLSVKKFAEVDWDFDKKKTEEFYKKTIQLLQSAPNDLAYSTTGVDVEVKFPIIYLSAKKN
ncbi:MAG: hypothetical protein A3D65_02375 [Candidatus Lloydbacteria bacterium RIFCSPHIGHO2_02_FULL_50_13]|uniref:Methyltransferase domain-containing protein n=1 Tax=Candidatus Lloydbacteria bacterium RIFCSPHIGHO2_02_FULL_50_13 TaxID=1798661 RepID=A0A1G2D017_9BACT|nr:MAG: hypothetical protein A3D65_02375 [Candidatus Lloydbacteria bacterium RIFCSPHIGHO2_02_FULL_50_13]